MSALDWPRLGFGVGLRAEHYPHVLAQRPSVDWFEAITENYLDSGGRPLYVLEEVRRDYPLALPYTEESLAHVTERVRRVQDVLGRRVALENPSTYVAFAHSRLGEWEFLAALADDADCGLLLDVNNVYVSAHNLGFDPRRYLDAIPVDRVAQIHLAGFSDMGSFLFDTHSAPVHDDVWALYRRALRRFSTAATLVEWDADIPPFERLQAEAERARREAAASVSEEEHERPTSRRALAAPGSTGDGGVDRAGERC